MRIGIDASRANLDAKTGTEWYAFQVIQKLLPKLSQRAKVVLYVKEPLNSSWPPLPQGVTVRVLRWPPQLLWTQLRLAWEMLLQPPDILFVPAHTIPIISPRKTITTLHDIGFERYQALYDTRHIGPAWLSPIIRILTFGRYGSSELDYHRWSARLALRKAARIVTVSKFSKKEIIDQFKVDPEKIVVIPCGYNPEFHVIKDQATIDRVHDTFALPKDFFLFIGRIEEKKNIKTLLEAYHAYRDRGGTYSLALAGKPGYGYEAYSSLLKQKGVRTLGWVPYRDLPILMNAAAGFVFPSAYEGFGIPILEAMACHIPVITSNTSAMPETAGSAALLVDPSNCLAIAEAMQTLEHDYSTRERLITAGVKHITQFSWEHTARQLGDLIAGL